MELLNVDTSKQLLTTKDQKVNPTLYEPLTPLISMDKNALIISAIGQELVLQMNYEQLKGAKKEDFLIFDINFETEKVNFITFDELNPESGDAVATFPDLVLEEGSSELVWPNFRKIIILCKSNIVVRDAETNNYSNQKVSDSISKFQSESDYKMDDVICELLGGELDGNEIQINDNTTVNASEYVPVMSFAEIAIKRGIEMYDYEMAGEYNAIFERDIEKIDWKSIVLSVYPDFDIDAAVEDPSRLTELEPFIAQDSILMQIDPNTGDFDFIYEPTIYFDYLGYEETEGEEYEEELVNDVDDTKCFTWTVLDEDKVDEKIPRLVIEANMKCMGPFILFSNLRNVI